MDLSTLENYILDNLGGTIVLQGIEIQGFINLIGAVDTDVKRGDIQSAKYMKTEAVDLLRERLSNRREYPYEQSEYVRVRIDELEKMLNEFTQPYGGVCMNGDNPYKEQFRASLRTQLDDEAQAGPMYRQLAQQAEALGYGTVANTLMSIANDEDRHHSLIYRMLGEV